MGWQPAQVLFPDVELLLSARLRAALADTSYAGTFVSNEIPATRRDRMVIWNRDGGGSDGATDRPRVRCRVWGESKTHADALARLVVTLMPTLVDGAPIVRTEHLSGPFAVPDESGQEQRYLNFVVHLRGESLASDPIILGDWSLGIDYFGGTS